jgi:hypothetical protein
MRASDRDRERALAALRAGCAEGYLSIDTFERRVEMTLAARSVADLRRMVADVGRSRSRMLSLARALRPRATTGGSSSTWARSTAPGCSTGASAA